MAVDLTFMSTSSSLDTSMAPSAGASTGGERPGPGGGCCHTESQVRVYLAEYTYKPFSGEGVAVVGQMSFTPTRMCCAQVTRF
jgi:hypothetical protein